MLVEPSFTSLQLFVACCCAVVCTYRPCFIANTLSAAIACNAPEHLQIKCSLADYTLIHQAKPIPIWTVISYSAAPGYFVPAHIYIGSRKLKTNPCCHSGHTSNNKKKKIQICRFQCARHLHSSTHNRFTWSAHWNCSCTRVRSLAVHVNLQRHIEFNRNGKRWWNSGGEQQSFWINNWISYWLCAVNP